jgi:hypothetical protein
VLHSTAKLDNAAKDGILKSGHVRCAAVDISHIHLATSGDDKVLKVWKTDGLQLLSSRSVRLMIDEGKNLEATDEPTAQENYPKSLQAFNFCAMGKHFWSPINLGTSSATPYIPS